MVDSDAYDVYMSGSVTVTGDAKLILCDDAYLAIYNGKNITVADDASLTVYGQAKNSGTLWIGNGSDVNNSADINGSITINGGSVDLQHYGYTAVVGDVTVNGGLFYAGTENGQKSVVGNVTVNGGQAAIDSYHADAIVGDVTVTGGSLVVELNDYNRTSPEAVAISGSVTVSGGYLHAESDNTGIKGNVTVNGGTLDVDAGWDNDDDYAIDGSVVVNGGLLQAAGQMAISGTVQSNMTGRGITYDYDTDESTETTLDVKTASQVDYNEIQIPVFYDLIVGGVPVTSVNANDVFGDGKVAFNAKTHTLTLNNYTYSGTGGDILNARRYAAGIYYGDYSNKLTITLKGTNSIEMSESYTRIYNNAGIICESRLTFNGTGKLTSIGGDVIDGYSAGIMCSDGEMYGKVTFEDCCTVIAQGGNGTSDGFDSYGIFGEAIIDDATVEAFGGTVPTDDSYGVNYVTIKEGKLTAGSYNTSGYAFSDGFEIANGGTIKVSDESVEAVEPAEQYDGEKFAVFYVEPRPVGTVKLYDNKLIVISGDDGEVASLQVKIRKLTEDIKTVKWSIPAAKQGLVALYKDAECTKPLGATIKSGDTIYIKGINPGTVTITFTNAEDETFTAACVVKVYDGRFAPTLNNGTDTNAYVPVYGYYADAYLNCQFIIPASDLPSAVNGVPLKQLRFYAASPASEKWSGIFEVYIGSYDGETISEFQDVSEHTLVYTGQLDGTGSVMDIVFDNDYVYEGGNILVTVREIEDGNYYDVKWYGVYREGASVQGYNYQSIDDITPTQRNFAPKVTLFFQSSHTHDFTYTVDGATVTAICNGNGDCDFTEGLSITILAPENLTYDGTVKTATLSTGYDTTLFPDVYEIVYYKDGRAISAKNVKDAGTYTAKVTVGDVTAALKFTIEKADPKFAVPTGITAKYGDTLADVTLPKGWKWKNPDTGVGKVGAQTFLATYTPVLKANYNTVTNISIPVTVEKATPTYTVPTELTAKYGDTLADVTLPSGWTWADSTQSVGNAGTSTFKATYTPADTENYSIVENVDVNVTVGKKTVTVTANDQTKVYGDADPEFTYTADGLVGSDDLTGALSREAGENAGTYAIVVGTLSAGDNYEISLTSATLTVSAKSVKIVANDQRKASGSADPEFTYTVDGLVGGDALTGALTREAGETVGTYAIGIGTLSAGDNYDIDFTGATLTISGNSAEIEVNVGDNAPKTEVDVNEGIVNNLLTEEEKKALAEGKQVSVYLEVVAVDDKTISADDKAKIASEARKSGMTVGMYLDLSLLKKVGTNNAVAIHDTDGNMIKVTVTVPEEFRSTDSSKTRTFYVVRVHDGETTVLGEATGDTVTFETDKFSTYALTYKDGTEGGTFAWWWIVIAVVAVACVCLIVILLVKKKNENKGGEANNSEKTEKTDE